MLQIRRVSKSSSSSSRIEFHRVRDNFTLRSRLLVWEIREGISSGAEFGEERSVVPKRALPSLRHTVSDSLNGDGMGCHLRRWDDESNKRANKSLKTFLLKLRGMYISGGVQLRTWTPLKLLRPVETRQGGGEGEKKLDEVSIPLFIKACRETGSWPGPGGQEMKVFPRGRDKFPVIS